MKRTSILALLLCLVIVREAPAIRGIQNYPKLLTYSSAMNDLPPAVRDTLSRYDVLVCMDRPETIAGLRARNPDQRYLWEIQPQYVEGYTEADPWWLPDTTWSAKRLVMFYAKQNDWYMRDVNGEVITDGRLILINWTRYCPVGTFGTSKGLRASQWMASVALPTIALSGRGLPVWSWDSEDSYNGYMFEILVDCLGSYGWQTYQYADPNQDGVADGVTHTCTMGGADDPLSVLFREENEDFYQRLTAAFPYDFVFTINENTSPVGPWWRTRLSGMKLENWMRGWGPTWVDWWDWFYGKTPPSYPEINWGAGYYWAEQTFDKPAVDRLKGWDLSFIVTWKEQNKSEAENLRQMRFGLGTSMLGDGYFDYSYDARHPQWQPEFDWDFGVPVGEFDREVYGQDTVYVRVFTKGMVEVNPAANVVHEVPAQDTRFTLWIPVQDLRAVPFGPNGMWTQWTSPEGEDVESDSFELRYATTPITLENWNDATPYAGNPVSANPGDVISLTITGLPIDRTYYLATRSHTRGHLEPVLSNVAEVAVGEIIDLIPPGSIEDLRSTRVEPHAVSLAWTSQGDDGALGTATRTLMRFLLGETIDSEDDWARATVVNGLGDPLPPGSTETFRKEGLDSDTVYGFAVRAEDEDGNVSALGAPLLIHTPVQPPPSSAASNGSFSELLVSCMFSHHFVQSSDPETEEPCLS